MVLSEISASDLGIDMGQNQRPVATYLQSDLGDLGQAAPAAATTPPPATDGGIIDTLKKNWMWVALGVGVLGFLWWRNSQRTTRAVAALPTYQMPDLDGLHERKPRKKRRSKKRRAKKGAR